MSAFLPFVPTHHSLLGFDEGPAEAVHFGVEPAGVAQVVAGAIPPPQRGLDGATVDALPAFGQVFQQLWGGRSRGERRWGTAAGDMEPHGALPRARRAGIRAPGGQASGAVQPSEVQFPGSDRSRVVIFFLFSFFCFNSPFFKKFFNGSRLTAGPGETFALQTGEEPELPRTRWGAPVKRSGNPRQPCTYVGVSPFGNRAEAARGPREGVKPPPWCPAGGKGVRLAL